MKVQFILQRGHVMKKEHNKEVVMNQDEVYVLLHSKKIEYPIMQGDSIRLIKTKIEDSTFTVAQERKLTILLKEIDY